MAMVMTVPMKEPDADELSGTHDMDLDARCMDQDGERPGEGSLCDSGK